MKDKADEVFHKGKGKGIEGMRVKIRKGLC